MRWGYFFLILILFVAGCAVNPVTGRKELSIINVTPEQEVALGGKAYSQALQQMGGVYPDRALNDYVNRIGQQVASKSHRPGLTYHFNVVNDSTPNAFALPGGYIAITRGLLVAMEDEAQLAAVLAHEVGHVTARHSVQEIQRSTLMNMSVGVLGGLAGNSGYGQVLTQVGALTTNLMSKKYSREQESEADRLSIDYLANSGYALQGAVELQTIFIEKLEKGNANSDWLSGMMRTHPVSKDRLDANREQIAEEYPSYRSSKGLDKNNYRRQISGLLQTQKAYALYDQARELEANGQIDRSIEVYHKAMQQAPKQGLLLTGLGMAYLRNEDVVPAKRYLTSAVRVDPNYFKSHMGLGYLYLQDRQPNDAAQQLEASLKLLPTVEGTFLLGQAEEGRGNTARARELYQVVVNADSSGKLGQAAAGRLRALQ